MIITKNGVELRNLEEQVLKNKEDIANHYNIDRVLGDFGIRIIGRLDTAEEIEGLTGTEYGDAYAIGKEPPYTFYIWTRPDPNSGHPNDYWLNIGPIAIEGPEGPQGEKGDTGARGESTKWRTGSGDPGPTISSDKLNDLYLDTLTGNVWQVKEQQDKTLYWTFIANIKGLRGPQGPKGDQGTQGIQGIQGEKGDTGDVGGFINIIGILPNVDQLEEIDPATLNNMTYAYLVGTQFPYNLYVQVGLNSDTADWEDMGPLNVSTLVSVNGQYQNLWNADTKIDKVTSTGATKRAYTVMPDGTQGVVQVTASANEYTIVERRSGGRVSVGTPIEDDNAVTFAQHKALLAQLEALASRVDKLEPSKNLFRCDYTDGTDIVAGPTTITVWGQYSQNTTLKTLREICPNASAGKTYSLRLIVESGTSDGGDTMSDYDVQMWFGNDFPMWYGNEHQSFVMSTAMLDSPVTFSVNGYAGQYGPEGGTFILKVMMNEGSTILPWEPPVK